MAFEQEKQVIELIKRNNKILILPSSPIDGDSLGSAVALYLALKKLGKDVTVVCSKPIPEALKFLPNLNIFKQEITSSKDFIISLDCKNAKVETVKSDINDDKVNIIITPKEGTINRDDITFHRGELNYDLIITVDTAELSQLHEVYENNIEIFQDIPVINIDHHISNAYFGKINLVDIMSSSTTEIILPILERFSADTGVQLIDEDIATLLLLGIITDTGSFQNPNTTPQAFASSAKLVSYGARQQEIIQHVYKTKQLSQLKLWGRVLSKIQTDEKHRMVWSSVSQQDIKDTASTMDETTNIIDELMTNAPGAEVVLLIKERAPNTVSVSIRSTTPTVDSASIAQAFGGGGHTQAAAFTLNDTSLIDTEYKILTYIREYQEKRLGFQAELNEDPIIDIAELIEKAKESQKTIENIESKSKSSYKFEK